jgi:hypothetical protein
MGYFLNPLSGISGKKNRRILFAGSIFILISFACSPKVPDMTVRSNLFQSKNRSIVIQHFVCYPEMATGLSKSFAQGLGGVMALEIQKSLWRMGHLQSVVVPADESATGGDLLLRGRIIRLSGGHRLHRMTLEVFGYGRCEAQVMGEVIEMQSSTPLLSFFITRGSSWTWRGNERAIREAIEEIAESIAKHVLQEPK